MSRTLKQSRLSVTIRTTRFALVCCAMASLATLSRANPPVTSDVASILRIWPDDPKVNVRFDEADIGEKVTRNEADAADFSVSNVTRAWLVRFQPVGAGASGPAVIIAPGGGYTFEAMWNEGIAVGQRFASDGVNAFVLKYRLPNGTPTAEGAVPLPEQDILRAIQFLRANSERLNVDPHRVGVVGFSAGGHVAASAATMFEDAARIKVSPDDAVARRSARPDFAILAYPVVTLDVGVLKSRSAPALLGTSPSPSIVAEFSADQRLTPAATPLFIVCAKDDKTISYHHSERLVSAAFRAKVPHEFLLLNHDGHAFGLGTGPESKTWYPKCLDWLKSRDILK